MYIDTRCTCILLLLFLVEERKIVARLFNDKRVGRL